MKCLLLLHLSLCLSLSPISAQERSGRFRTSNQNPPFFGADAVPIIDLDTFFEDSAPGRPTTTTTQRPSVPVSSRPSGSQQAVRLILLDDEEEDQSSRRGSPTSFRPQQGGDQRSGGVAFRLPSSFQTRQDSRIFEPSTSRGQNGGIVFFDVVGSSRDPSRERQTQTRFNQPPPPRRQSSDLEGQIFVVNGNSGSFQSQSRPQFFRPPTQPPPPQFTPVIRNLTSVPFRPSHVAIDTSRTRFQQAPSRPLPPPAPRPLPQKETIPEEITEFNFQRLQPQAPRQRQPQLPQPRPRPQEQQQPNNDLSFQGVVRQQQQPQRSQDFRSFDNGGASFGSSAQDVDEPMRPSPVNAQQFRGQFPRFHQQQPATSVEEDLTDATFASVPRQLAPSSRLFPSTIPTGDTSREVPQQSLTHRQPPTSSVTPGSTTSFANFDFREHQQQRQTDEVTQPTLDYEDERLRTTFSDYDQTQDDHLPSTQQGQTTPEHFFDPSQGTSSFQEATEPSTTEAPFVPRRVGVRRRIRVKTTPPPLDTTVPQQSVLQPPPIVHTNPESVQVTPVGFRRQPTPSRSPVDAVHNPDFESGDASIRDETVHNIPDEDVVSFGEAAADVDAAPERSRETSAVKTRLPTTEARKSSMLRRGDRRRGSKASAAAKIQVAQDRSASRSNSIDDVSLQVSRSSGPVVAGSPATACDPLTCRLPNCYCGGNRNPGNLDPSQTPQMVLLTFDDAVNDLNWPLYTRLFNEDRLNPNGCPILATFYVSHEWTDYAKVQALYSQGHEIASHSISHGDGRDYSKTKWYDEIYGEKEILSTYGSVNLHDIRGMRSPFLALGGEKQFSMLYETNFTYDSSLTVAEAHPPVWPFTLDHLHPHPCAIPPCPRLSYPGFWEIPMQALNDINGAKCSMADGCSFSQTADGIYEMLTKNFERHYTSNRAPFGLFYHASWFLVPYRQEGFVKFLDEILKKEDVYFVTSLQLLDYMKSPQPLSTVNSFAPWDCENNQRAMVCQRPQKCELRFKGDVRYMSTCASCPDKYPWVGDTGVTNHAHTIS